VSVTAASLTASTSNVVKTYSGDTTAAGTAVVTAGALFGTDSLSGGTFAFATKNAGTANKTVTVLRHQCERRQQWQQLRAHAGGQHDEHDQPRDADLHGDGGEPARRRERSRLRRHGDGLRQQRDTGQCDDGQHGFRTTALGSSVAGLYPINGSGSPPTTATTSLSRPRQRDRLHHRVQAALVITADNKTKTYGAALPAFTASYAGFISGDTAASVTGLQVQLDGDAEQQRRHLHESPLRRHRARLLSVGYVPGTLTINPAALTLSGTRSYNGHDVLRGAI